VRSSFPISLDPRAGASRDRIEKIPCIEVAGVSNAEKFEGHPATNVTVYQQAVRSLTDSLPHDATLAAGDLG
jgi:hypothetical protein